MLATKKTWALHITLFLITCYTGTSAKKKVCVIGAGRVGLAATKLVADQHFQFEPIAFERNSDVGGVWIYRDDPELDENGLRAHSGIYKSLKTITTKEVMVYPDYKTFESDKNDPPHYVSHETFLNYMRNHTDRFSLRQYIQFDSLVTTVKPLNDKCTHGTTRWSLENWNLTSHKTATITCDAVILCNGRYSKPNIPGMNTFKGKMLHSRSYRIPQVFAGKTVMILGAQASDYFCLDLEGFPENVIEVNAVVKIKGNKFIFDNGNDVSADVLIFCTGYMRNFPFLIKNSGIEFNEYRLLNLHENFINKKYPSMALIGLGDDDGFTEMYYSEAKYFLKSLLGSSDEAMKKRLDIKNIIRDFLKL